MSRSERTTGLRCTTKPTPLTCTFTVVEDRREVELVLELRARRGQAIFEADSLVLLHRPRQASADSQR